MKIKAILPAMDIPLGSTVSKVTGAKEYILINKITIFVAGGDKRELIADEGTVFLSPMIVNGNINSIPTETELIWHTDSCTLKNYFYRMAEGPPQ